MRKANIVALRKQSAKQTLHACFSSLNNYSNRKEFNVPFDRNPAQKDTNVMLCTSCCIHIPSVATTVRSSVLFFKAANGCSDGVYVVRATLNVTHVAAPLYHSAHLLWIAYTNTVHAVDVADGADGEAKASLKTCAGLLTSIYKRVEKKSAVIKNCPCVQHSETAAIISAAVHKTLCWCTSDRSLQNKPCLLLYPPKDNSLACSSFVLPLFSTDATPIAINVWNGFNYFWIASAGCVEFRISKCAVPWL